MNDIHDIAEEVLKYYPFGNAPFADEVFKPVKEYEGLYEISSYGRVKSLRGKIKIVRPTINGNYFAVSLHKNGIRKKVTIHRLVAETFIPNPNHLPEVDHINGFRLNNHIAGLQWVTRSENLRRARENRQGNYIDTETRDLVILQNRQAVTTSLKVAEVFGKEHFNVIRDIEELISKITLEKGKLNFGDTLLPKMFIKDEYCDAQGKIQPMYYMNRDGFTLLAMGFTGSAALKFKLAYIAKFNELEQRLIIPAETLPLREKYSMLMEVVRLIKDEDLRNRYFEYILELISA